MSEPAWMAPARELVGLREIVGSKHEPKIVQFFEHAGHAWVRDDETAWCAAFVNAMLKKAGYLGTGALNARSFLKWGKEIKTPVPGCIVVFWRGKPDGWQGHVAFFVSETADKITVLGGNQGNAVSVAAYPRSQLLGYRMPADPTVDVPSPVPKPKPMVDVPFIPPDIPDPVKETKVNPLILGTLFKVVERVLERPSVPVENSKSGVVASAVVDAIKDSPNVAVVPVEAASKSKTIWLQAAGVVASMAAFFGLDIPADDLAAVIGGIQAAVAVGTVVLRKWFTRSVTPAAAARP
jgi:uncharacterized protein (TIGR02594 family)